MTLRIPAKVVIHVWSYDFYDMTLPTGKQRRHMINLFTITDNFDVTGYRHMHCRVYLLCDRELKSKVT